MKFKFSSLISSNTLGIQDKNNQKQLNLHDKIQINTIDLIDSVIN